MIYKIGTNLYEALDFEWDFNPKDFARRKQSILFLITHLHICMELFTRRTFENKHTPNGRDERGGNRRHAH